MIVDTMRLSFPLLILLVTAGTPSALADAISIKQMDDSFVSMKDTGMQEEKAEDIELSVNTDYQQSILSNPYADSYARMNSINSLYAKSSDIQLGQEAPATTEESSILAVEGLKSPLAPSTKRENKSSEDELLQ